MEEKLRLVRPLLAPAKWRALRFRWLMERDVRRKRELESWLDILLAQKATGLLQERIMLPPPEGSKLSGEYQVGQLSYPGGKGQVFGIRGPEWLRHCGIFGKTGSGKTTLMLNLLREICRQNKPFLIFDYKRNYRDLLSHPDFADKEIYIFTVGREVSPLYFNPKQGPVGVEEHIWIKQLAQIIEKVYLLGPGANDVFMEAAHHGTFAEMKSEVLGQNKRARELLWWASVKRTLNAINYPGLGHMVNAPQCHDIAELLNKQVILELDGLSASDQAFVIGSLLLWIYHYRMRQPEREVLKHFLIVEEAHHLFLNTRREEDIADVLMREIRELGEAMLIIDQHPHKLSPSALGNVGTKFCLSLALNQDVKAVADAMLLEFQERRYLAMLQVGQAICRCDRLSRPILLNLPPFDLKKGAVDDEAISRHMRRYSPLLKPNQLMEAQSGGIRDVSQPETPSPLARIMLESLAREPALGLVQRFKKLGLGLAEGYKVLAELEAKKLALPIMIDGKKLYDPTVRGRNEIGCKPGAGRGGLEHRYWLEQVRQQYAKPGVECRFEQGDIDLVIQKDGHVLAVQMETGKSDLLASLCKLARYKAQMKYALACNRETENRLKSLLQDLAAPGRELIQVSYIKDFLKNPPELIPS